MDLRMGITGFLLRTMELDLISSMPDRFLKCSEDYMELQSIRVQELAWLFVKESQKNIRVLFQQEVKKMKEPYLQFPFLCIFQYHQKIQPLQVNNN